VRYVLDCNVAVKWFVPEALSDVARLILGQVASGTVSLVAPDVIVAELGHTLRSYVIAGRLGKTGISAEDSYSAIDEFLAMNITLVPGTTLASHAMRLSIANMATFYDSLYVALAIREDVKVLTADDRMASAFGSLDRAVTLSTLQHP